MVIWGLREGAEHGKMQSIEEFLQEELFGKHMGLERIEVMRAHRTNIRTRMLSSRNRLGGPRPIHVYVLRYTDKVRILKVARKTLKGKKFLDSQIFVSDDVSKKVRNQRNELRNEYLQDTREREEVEFTYIPWSVPAQILYKEKGEGKLKSYKLNYD